MTNFYLHSGQLRVEILDEGHVWLDTGTPDALAQATAIVQALESRQGVKIGCVEELAYQLGFISADELQSIGARLGSSEYGRYLCGIASRPPGGG